MSNERSRRRRSFGKPLTWASFPVLLALVTVGCGDTYEPATEIEGVYQPTLTAPNGSHCVQIEGRRDGWLSYSTTQPIICQPIRVSELGLMTYGWEVRQPGLKLEVGRLEFADAGVFIATDHLRETGRFQYTERSPTLGDWTRHNPFKTAMLVLVGLVVAVTIPLRAAARDSERRRERNRLEAEAARERLKVAQAASDGAHVAAAAAASHAEALAVGKASISDASEPRREPSNDLT